ncbi:DUF2975 domain-containing protein [Jeotgalibacillus aurantiacus]|uniref:DUF2975 domain-containing protein n=1 Tax=Jeotgalibacillus aurantiacus TaxID=2763266 RepID=UPI001D0BE2B9|nr:DUF2975 domain-containing protein [Jeotgalibacillus aurantiacus]
MKKGSTIFLKLVLFVMALVVGVFCAFALAPFAWNVADDPVFGIWLLLIIGAMYVTVVPFFIALFQSFKLLGYIDRNEAFSSLSVAALKKIKICAFVISLIYVMTMPFFYAVAELDDAPGVILVGAVLVGASFVVGVFAYLLQMLLNNAIEIKTENDLTV